MGLVLGSLSGATLFLNKKTVESYLGQSGSFSKDTLIDWVYEQIVKDAKEGMDLKTVRLTILNVLNVVNCCMPGMQYDPPHRKTVKNFYDEWKHLKEEEKKEKLKEFIVSLLENPNKFSQYTEVTGVVAPPLTMIVKRVGEQSPQLKPMLDYIPDVLFVPLFTIGALITVKLVEKNALQQILQAFSPTNYGGASSET
ncbi:hypothetical protein EJ110_NYTH03771 [Nymphaea thermarum]|nr:hypothetical protein EJ110_NYTH03771 [Nymphaea thermarum]